MNRDANGPAVVRANARAVPPVTFGMGPPGAAYVVLDIETLAPYGLRVDVCLSLEEAVALVESLQQAIFTAPNLPVTVYKAAAK